MTGIYGLLLIQAWRELGCEILMTGSINIVPGRTPCPEKTLLADTVLQI